MISILLPSSVTDPAQLDSVSFRFNFIHRATKTIPYTTRPQWKTTSMEVDLNWRQLKLEDDLNGRRPQRKMTSMEDDLNWGRPQDDNIKVWSPYRKTTWQKEWDMSLPRKPTLCWAWPSSAPACSIIHHFHSFQSLIHSNVQEIGSRGRAPIMILWCVSCWWRCNRWFAWLWPCVVCSS